MYGLMSGVLDYLMSRVAGRRMYKHRSIFFHSAWNILDTISSAVMVATFALGVIFISMYSESYNTPNQGPGDLLK